MMKNLTSTALLFLITFLPNSIFCQDMVDWAKTINGTDEIQITSIEADNLGNIFVAGNFRGTAFIGDEKLTSKGGTDIFLCMANKPGEINWVRHIGGKGDDFANDIGVTSKVYFNSKTVYIGGGFENEINGGGKTLVSKGGLDIFLFGYNYEGGLIFEARDGGKGDDAINSVGNTGAASVTGYFSDTATIRDSVLISKGGKDLFFVHLYNLPPPNRVFAGGSKGDDEGLVVNVSDNFPLLAGTFSDSFSFEGIKITSAGKRDIFQVDWFNLRQPGNKNFIHFGGPGDDILTDFIISKKVPHREYLFTGTFENQINIKNQKFTSKGGMDIFSAIFTPKDSLIMARTFGSIGDDTNPKIIHWYDMQTGNIIFNLKEPATFYITGGFSGKLEIDGLKVFSNGGQDIFLTKMSNEGKALSLENFGGKANETVGSANSYQFDIYIAGTHDGISKIENRPLAHSGSTDGFFFRINSIYMDHPLNILETSTLRANFSSSGILFEHWDSFENNSLFEPIKHQGLQQIYSTSLWVGGFDKNGNLHQMAPTYGNREKDTYPGPVADSQYYSPSLDEAWDRVWRVDREALIYHKNNYNNPNYFIQDGILNWPAHGDTTIGQAANLAPFEDLNGNGKYEPMKGEYPKIKGDAAVYMIFNDDRNSKPFTWTRKTGMEVHAMAYAYDCPNNDTLAKTIFVDYKLINKSSKDYSKTYVGIWSGGYSGNFSDDYSGVDTQLNLSYIYNADSFDETGSGFGDYPASQGVQLLTDTIKYFVSHHNTAQYNGFPEAPQHFYFYHTARWKNGSCITKGRLGIFPGPCTNFMYPGDPRNPAQWSEVTDSAEPGPRLFVMSFHGDKWNSGDTIAFTIAFPFARARKKNDPLASVDQLKITAQYLKNNFQSFSPCISKGLYNKEKGIKNALSVFPNPSEGKVTFSLPEEISSLSTIEVFTINGKNIYQRTIPGKKNKQFTMDLTGVPDGAYFYRIKLKEKVYTGKLILH